MVSPECTLGDINSTLKYWLGILISIYSPPIMIMLVMLWCFCHRKKKDKPVYYKPAAMTSYLVALWIPTFIARLLDPLDCTVIQRVEKNCSDSEIFFDSEFYRDGECLD